MPLIRKNEKQERVKIKLSTKVVEQVQKEEKVDIELKEEVQKECSCATF